MTVTMKKVARRAGVSISTVSRVLSGRPAVREEVSRKVKQVMEELGYTPNIIAKSLVSKSAHCLCILLPGSYEQAILGLIFMETIRGIITEAGSLGYDIQICTGADEQEELEAVSGLLKGQRVDGVILLPSSGEEAVMGYLQSSGYPFVLASRCGGEGIISVGAQQNIAAFEAAQQLVRAGYELGTTAARQLIEQIRHNNWECKYG